MPRKKGQNQAPTDWNEEDDASEAQRPASADLVQGEHSNQAEDDAAGIADAPEHEASGDEEGDYASALAAAQGHTGAAEEIAAESDTTLPSDETLESAKDERDAHETDTAGETDEDRTDNAIVQAEHSSQGAEPEREYDAQAWREDTDNTHTDGGNGMHQEHYLSAEDTARLAAEESRRAHSLGDDQAPMSLHPRDIGRRINERSQSAVHASMGVSNRDPTRVGSDPLREKGLRPPAPLDGVERTDDAGRPFDGGYLHTVDKGYPVGMSVNEHVPAPTATGGTPEGLLGSIHAPLPVPTPPHKLPEQRLQSRQEYAGDKFTLEPRHHAMLDAAELLRAKNAHTFTLAQVGGTRKTAQELENAGFLKSEAGMASHHFPESGLTYRLT